MKRRAFFRPPAVAGAVLTALLFSAFGCKSGDSRSMAPGEHGTALPTVQMGTSGSDDNNGPSPAAAHHGPQ